MSEPTPEDAGQDATGIGDDQLPDDLQPGENNPLAEGLEPGETAGDLLEEGKHADQDQQDQQDEQDGSSTSQDD
ncbi:hypothetical protein [Nocardioides marmotae]|uniref:hypothetical protein n=1 Tax=Nocardioides marmotae TaxID=2663857 RepID=UPI0013282816|nr:hypothetical protein [Nocardioides marmotae]MBC9735527.1 hypothetical protein [Nocardioides marmotae]MTB86624.1 hypothetical protein [Nocardioides marmotae]